MLRHPVLLIFAALALGIAGASLLPPWAVSSALFAALSLVALCVAALLLWRRRHGVAALGAGLVGVACLGAWSWASRGDPPPLAARCALPEKNGDPGFGVFRGTVDAAVTRKRRNGTDALVQRTVLADLEERCADGWHSRPGRIDAGLLGDVSLARGDRVEARLRLSPFRPRGNPVGLDPMALARARRLNARADSDLPAAHVAFGDGPLHWLDRGRAATAERFERVLSPERAALCKALTIGDFGGVDDEVRERWSDAGMAHLLSISGLHVGLLAWLVYSGCLWLLRRVPLVTTRYSAQRAAAWVSLPPLILFCLWSGAAVAAVRATVMVAVYLFGRALARPSVATNALGVAGAGILLWDPHSLWDPSFLLSFAAVTALMLLPPQKPARHWYGRVARVLVLALLASVVSTLATAPIMAYAFGRISLVAPLPNLLAVPLCNLVAVPLTILFALLSPLSAGVEQVLGALLSLVIGALDAIALYAAAVPFAAVDLPRPAWHEITAWAVFCTALLLCVRQRPARYVALAAAVVLAAQVGVRMLAARGDGVLHIAHVDVGQGDAAIVRFPAGSVMLFDAGGALFEGGFDPGRRVLAPLLRAQGIRTLDLVVVSHPDPDHLQGLLYVAEHFAIRELWTSGFGYDPRSPDDPSATPRDYQALQRLYQSVKAQGGVVRYVADMPAESERDGVALRLLHPRPSPDEAEGLTYYPGLSDNDNSVVLHLTYGDCTALFPGDIEADVEAKLAPILPHADVFKSPHHGSRTSSSQALLDAVDATAVVISLGEHNRFGFPKPETLARYAAAKLTVWRTDLLGQITLSTDGSAWQLQAEREGVTHTIACRRR